MAAASSNEQVVRMRVAMARPPAGVRFCLQRGKDELVGGSISQGEDLQFDFDVRARPGPDGDARLLGPFVQGPPTARFVYICVGFYAGQLASPWKRRIKVPLSGIAWAMVAGAANGRLEAAFDGTMRDGTPACASVKLTQPWKPCS